MRYKGWQLNGLLRVVLKDEYLYGLTASATVTSAAHMIVCVKWTFVNLSGTADINSSQLQ